MVVKLQGDIVVKLEGDIYISGCFMQGDFQAVANGNIGQIHISKDTYILIKAFCIHTNIRYSTISRRYNTCYIMHGHTVY